MASKPSFIEQAKASYNSLLNVHIHRKNLETHWAAKGEAILEPTTVNFPDYKGYTLLDYAIILGDIEKITTLISQNAKSKKADALAKKSENEFIINSFSFTVPGSSSEENKSTPLMRALLSRNITEAKKLTDQGCDVNQLYENTQYTAMDSALDIGNFEAVQYLVDHGARLDFVDSDGASFILKAIRTGNVDIVKFALSQNVDFKMQDYYGKTPMHYAPECNNPEIVNLILNDARFEAFKEKEDLLGRDPLQIAIDNDNQYFVDQINLPMIGREKKEYIEIDQENILGVLQYYLRLTNQNPHVLDNIEMLNKDFDLLSKSGHCSGFEFLFLILSDKEKGQDFFNALKTISKWDGTYESLSERQMVFKLRDQYSNIEELFRYITDHLIILQQKNISPELKEIIPDQTSRVQQYELIGEEEISLEKHFYINTYSSQSNIKPINEAQLAEYIAVMSRLPNTKVEIFNNIHATGMYVYEQGRLSYYDSNIKYQLPITDSIETVVKMINSFQYKMLSFKGPEMPIVLTTYKAKNFRDDYAFFKNDELPKTKDESIVYQNNSPNKFSHLHVAVLTDSFLDVSRLLASGQVDANAKDINGDTPLMLAIKNNKPKIVNEILKYSNGKDIVDLYNYAFTTNDDKIKELCLKAVTQILSSKKNITDEIILLLKQGDSVAKHFIDNYSEDLNAYLGNHSDVHFPNHDGEFLIRTYISQENNEFLALLLDMMEKPSDLDPELLVMAIEYNNESLAKKMAEFGVDVDFEVERFTQYYESVTTTARSEAKAAGMHDLVDYFDKLDHKVTESSSASLDREAVVRAPSIVFQYGKEHSSSEPHLNHQEDVDMDSTFKPK